MEIFKIIVFCLLSFNVESYVISTRKKDILDENDFPELKYLNESVDPCENFYEFSCGNYGKYNPLPEDQKMWDNYYILQEKIDNICSDLLGSKKKSHDPKAVHQIKDMYQGCVGYLKYDQYYNVRPMSQAVTNLGGWPLLQNKLPSYKQVLDFSWTEVGDIIAEYGLPFFFSWTVMPHASDADQFMIYLGKDGLVLPSSIITHPDDVPKVLFEDTHLEKRSTGPRTDPPYVSYVNKIANAICKETNCLKTPEEIHDEILKVLDVMRAISTSPSYPHRNSWNFSVQNIGDLQEWTDEFSKNYRTRIDWLEFFQHAFKQSDAIVSKDTKVYILNMTSVANILDLVEKSDPELIRNFIFTRLATYMAPDSSEEMWEAYNDLYKEQYGDLYPIFDRPDYCRRKVENSQMTFALTYEYLKYFFDSRKIQNANEMIADLKSAFTDLLDKRDWLDNDSKEAAKNKLNQMIELIGFPEFIANENDLDGYYKKLKVCRHDHFGNMQRLRAFNLKKSVEVLGHKRNRFSWSNSPLQVNAFYNPQNNRIVFPAAIMNSPFYQGEISLLDYARIGSIIGHEITHGFDTKGSMFDGQGNIKPIFSQETNIKFNETANCFRKQYSEYYVDEIEQNVDGWITEKENIADNGGLRQAYRAFLKVLGRENHNIVVKNYDAKQLFFIAFGTNWCKIDTEESLQIMSRDEHAPNRFRVQGPVSNMIEFSEAFHCKKGSKMNPENKCILW